MLSYFLSNYKSKNLKTKGLKTSNNEEKISKNVDVLTRVMV